MNLDEVVGEIRQSIQSSPLPQEGLTERNAILTISFPGFSERTPSWSKRASGLESLTHQNASQILAGSVSVVGLSGEVHDECGQITSSAEDVCYRDLHFQD
jgi:hypothetical protein